MATIDRGVPLGPVERCRVQPVRAAQQPGIKPDPLDRSTVVNANPANNGNAAQENWKGRLNSKAASLSAVLARYDVPFVGPLTKAIIRVTRKTARGERFHHLGWPIPAITAPAMSLEVVAHPERGCRQAEVLSEVTSQYPSTPSCGYPTPASVLTSFRTPRQ
jgi:hypothetical protein